MNMSHPAPSPTELRSAHRRQWGLSAYTAWLNAEQYTVATRTHAWSELFVRGHGQNWLGRGCDEGEALDDFLRQFAPSPVLRRMVEEAVALYEARSLAPLGDATAGLPPEPARAAPPASARPAAQPAEVPTKAALEVEFETKVAAIPAGPSFDASTLDLEEALDVLAELSKEIEQLELSVGAMAPKYQRRYLTLWVAKVRAIEEEVRCDEVEAAAAGVARHLRSLSRTWWPGSIPAHALDCAPQDALRSEVLGAGRPTSWSDVACALSEVFESDRADKEDDDGWFDEAACAPAAADPASELGYAVQVIERSIGPYLSSGAKAHQASRTYSVSDMERITNAVRTLRWVRRECGHTRTWVCSMGMVRRFEATFRPPYPALGRAADANYRPEESWARLLGRSPGKRALKRARREFFERRPALTATDVEIGAWVAEGLTHYSPEDLVDRIGEIGARVPELDPQLLDSRPLRRRLKRLSMRIENKSDGESDAADTPLVDTAAPSEIEAATPFEPPILGQARTLLENKHVLMLGNRKDPELERMLYEKLGLHADIRECTPRSVDSAVDSIRHGRKYDLVMLVTNFIGHSSERALRNALRTSGLPWYRVNSGRPLSCARSVLAAHAHQGS